MTTAILALGAGMLGGCVVKSAVGVATLPVRAGAKVVDWTTTSQAEADRNRGRRLRKAEAKRRREQRALAARCRADPADAACRDYSPPPR